MLSGHKPMVLLGKRIMSARSVAVLPGSWDQALKQETGAAYFQELRSFVQQQRRVHAVYPPPEKLFAAFQLCDLDDVRCVPEIIAARDAELCRTGW